MSDLAAAPAFAGMKTVGNGGGVHAALRHYPIVSVLARKGHADALIQKSGIADAARRSGANGVTALGIGPHRWLFLGQDLDQLGSLQGLASLSDHSYGVPRCATHWPKACPWICIQRFSPTMSR